jgi:PAS domain S-box-containing protein
VDQSSFASKFISRIQRIDTPRIESFLTQLVREKDFQRVVFDSLQEGILVLDNSHRVVFANETIRTLLGLHSRKVLGEPVERLLRARTLQALAEQFRADLQPIEQREVRVRTPRPRIYSVSVLPIDDEHGTVSHSIWIVIDQTETHRRAAERHQAESVRSLATLVSGIAHEIKNPLNSLNIHAQLIQAAVRQLEPQLGESPEATRLTASTRVLLDEIARLARIVDQFIKAARPPRPELRPAQVNEVVRAVADLLAPECTERHIALDCDLDPQMPLLAIDPEQLQQAVLNVAKNALEAIDKPEGRIVLRTALKADHALVEVEDNGCGIPEGDSLRIFEPYHTTKFNGTGLGLMVVYRIVQAHGGEIALDSHVGRGTRFRIALPVDDRPVRLIESHPGAPIRLLETGAELLVSPAEEPADLLDVDLLEPENPSEKGL